MNRQAVKKITIFKYSKIIFPSFLILIAYLITGYTLHPQDTIQTRVAGAAADNPREYTILSPTLSPTPSIMYPTPASFINSISNTPTAGASSSVTNNPTQSPTSSIINASILYKQGMAMKLK